MYSAKDVDPSLDLAELDHDHAIQFATRRRWQRDGYVTVDFRHCNRRP